MEPAEPAEPTEVPEPDDLAEPAPDEAPLELAIESLAFGGDGVARWKGSAEEPRALVVFVPGTAPGDRVRARIVEWKKSFARAALVDVLEPSPLRRTPPCPAFGSCGGCAMQHLRYEAQLDAKRAFVLDSLRRLGGIEWQGELRMHAGAELGTRTRARFAMNAKSGAVGFRRAHSHAVEDLEHCPALAPALDDALRALRTYVRALSPDERRALPGEISAACDELGFAFEKPIGDLPSRPLAPRVGALRFEVGAGDFFQGHATLLPELVDAVTRGLEGDEAWDLYAGVGLFARALAPRFQRVIGVESNLAAVDFGRRAISDAGEKHVRLERADVAAWLARRRGARADAVVLDPPRTGAKEIVPALLEVRPKSLRYVSCDPTTLARDLAALIAGGYRLERLEAFDLFPQTWHVETVAVLER